MLGRIFDQITGLRADLRMLISLVEVLIDRTTDHEWLTTREACVYAQCSDRQLRNYRATGQVRGRAGRWNRRDLQLIRRVEVLREVEEDC